MTCQKRSMRILFVSSYYSPAAYGWGYRQLCEEVVNGLFVRGHDVAVLTSTYGDGDETSQPYPVHRVLRIDPDWYGGKSAAWQFFVGRRQRERRAVAHLRQLVGESRPDVVFVWHAIGLPRVLLQEAEQLPGVAVAYYLANYLPELPDEYVAYWQVQPVHWTAKLLKHPLTKLALYLLAREGKPLSLRYENVICVSKYVRHRLVSQGLISANAVVIHNGVDLSCFSPDSHNGSEFSSAGLRCLVAGIVVPEKGIHTAIDALARLQAQDEPAGITLTILGDGPVEYLEYLRKKVYVNRLQNVVEFRPPVPREQMPKVLTHYDILILPSEYNEPLARAIQEAMAMGLLVIGTTTGGSGELLMHERTGLAFEPGNPQSLAAQLSRALNEPELATRLAKAGQREVVERFDIQRTIEQIEGYLLNLIESKEDE